MASAVRPLSGVVFEYSRAARQQDPPGYSPGWRPACYLNGRRLYVVGLGVYTLPAPPQRPRWRVFVVLPDGDFLDFCTTEAPLLTHTRRGRPVVALRTWRRPW